MHISGGPSSQPLDPNLGPNGLESHVNKCTVRSAVGTRDVVGVEDSPPAVPLVSVITLATFYKITHPKFVTFVQIRRRRGNVSALNESRFLRLDLNCLTSTTRRVPRDPSSMEPSQSIPPVLGRTYEKRKRGRSPETHKVHPAPRLYGTVGSRFLTYLPRRVPTLATKYGH